MAAVAFAVFTALLLLPGVPAAAADDTSAHWADRTLVVRDEVKAEPFRSALRRAVEGWNAAGADLRLSILEGSDGGCDDLRTGEIVVCGTRYTDRQLGEAAAHGDADGHIYAAIVKIDLRPLSADSLVSLLCHELGHALGLGHRTDRSSCMFAEVGATRPDAKDAAQLRSTYGHEERVDRCARRSLKFGAFCF